MYLVATTKIARASREPLSRVASISIDTAAYLSAAELPGNFRGTRCSAKIVLDGNGLVSGKNEEQPGLHVSLHVLPFVRRCDNGIAGLSGFGASQCASDSSYSVL